MDIIVGLLLLGISALVIFDASRLGVGWRENEGPAPGSFPLYIAVLLGLASLINIGAAWKAEAGGFVTRLALGRVLMVLVPSIVYVGLIDTIGIYVASAIFIFGFMAISRENIFKALLVGAGVPVALFLMFEKWFLVPLPRGPVEAWLGV